MMLHVMVRAVLVMAVVLVMVIVLVMAEGQVAGQVAGDLVFSRLVAAGAGGVAGRLVAGWLVTGLMVLEERLCAV